MKSALVYLIWLFVMRFKRVEVQVVTDDKETTFYIFKKLSCATWYHATFMGLLIVLQITLIIKLAFDRFMFESYTLPIYYTVDARIIGIVKFVDIMIILFLFGSVFNFGLLILSIFRLIKFIFRNKVIRIICKILMIPLSLMYLNENLQMMTFHWGSLALSLNIYLHIQDGFDIYLYF